MLLITSRSGYTYGERKFRIFLKFKSPIENGSALLQIRV